MSFGARPSGRGESSREGGGLKLAAPPSHLPVPVILRGSDFVRTLEPESDAHDREDEPVDLFEDDLLLVEVDISEDLGALNSNGRLLLVALLVRHRLGVGRVVVINRGRHVERGVRNGLGLQLVEE